MTDGFNPVVRALRDAGLAAWFGGSLMGVVGTNRAVQDLSDPAERLALIDEVWDRWTVPGGLAIAAHLLGSAVMAWDNKSRLLGQRACRRSCSSRAASPLWRSQPRSRSVTRKQALSAALKAAHETDETVSAAVSAPLIPPWRPHPRRPGVGRP